MKEEKKIMTGKLVLSQQDVEQHAPSLPHLFPDQYAQRLHSVHLHLKIGMLAKHTVCL